MFGIKKYCVERLEIEQKWCKEQDTLLRNRIEALEKEFKEFKGLCARKKIKDQRNPTRRRKGEGQTYTYADLYAQLGLQFPPLW